MFDCNLQVIMFFSVAFCFAAEEKKEEKTEKMDTSPPADEKKGTKPSFALSISHRIV